MTDSDTPPTGPWAGSNWEDPPEDWLRLQPPEVSPDFVERTLQRVMVDRAEGHGAEESGIEKHGDKATGEGQLPLDAYQVPAPSADFVQRTMAALRASDGKDTPADELWLDEVRANLKTPEPSADFVATTLAHIQRDRLRTDPLRAESVTAKDALPLQTYRVPEPSADFVPRTLAAIQADTQAEQPAAVPTQPAPIFSFRRAAALAAALLATVALWFALAGDNNGAGQPGPNPEPFVVDGPAPTERQLPDLDEGTLERSLGIFSGAIQRAEVVVDPSLRPVMSHAVWDSPFADESQEGRLQGIQATTLGLMAGDR